MATELKVLSLNAWGLTFADDYKERMIQIFDRLRESNYDIVILQEVFVSADINRIKSLRKHNYPYVHHFCGGVVGTGLMVLSKYRILDVLVFPYIQSGMIYHRGGDWFGRKSVCYCLIDHPQSEIMVFGTHTHAKYCFNFFDQLRCLQLFQMAKIVKTISRGGFPIILAGDFNTESFESCFKFLLQHCNLKDACAEVHSISCNEFYTCNHPTNPYGENKETAKRIDYILYNERFIAKDFCYDFETNKQRGIVYSDHTGIAATLELVPANSDVVPSNDKDLLDSIKLLFRQGYEHSTVNIPVFVAIFISFAIIFLSSLTIGSLGLVSSVFGNILSGISGIALILCLFTLALVYISRVQQKRAYKNGLMELELLEENFIE